MLTQVIQQSHPAVLIHEDRAHVINRVQWSRSMVQDESHRDEQFRVGLFHGLLEYLPFAQKWGGLRHRLLREQRNGIHTFTVHTMAMSVMSPRRTGDSV